MSTTEVQRLGGFLAIPLDQIKPSPENPRERLTEIDELAVSIRENGLIQPLVVQPLSEREFQIVAGHRRYAAVGRLGWTTVACIVRRPLRPDEELLAMLVENGQRANLDPIEEARALRRLKVTEGMNDSEIARKVGRSQTHVSSRLSMLALDVDDQEELRAGQMSVTEAAAKGRLASGRVRPGAIGKKGPNHLGTHHELASRAKARCVRLGHGRGRGAGVGGIACGACWESVIRADERQHLHDQSELRGRCVLCDTNTPTDPAEAVADPETSGGVASADYDEAVVLRRLDGDGSARMRKADRIEIVHRARHRGMSLLDIERITGITKPGRYLSPNTEVASA